jgi:predicted molibdopterin-dependent oxidoreductase YjgC
MARILPVPGSPGRPPRPVRAMRAAGHHHSPAGREASRGDRRQPTKIDNDLYVRTPKCILCYKCVEACGEDAQGTFAIAVAGRGFDARISTEQATPVAQNQRASIAHCIGVCRRVLMAKTEYDMRARPGHGTRRPDRDVDDLPVLRGRLRGRPARQTNGSVTSPLDSSVTEGHLCIKGRFGFEFVNQRPKPPA